MPDAFIADPQSGDKDGTILITVDAATASYTARYGSTVRPFPIKNPTGPPPNATSTVVIESLLPNPHGDDDQLEEARCAIAARMQSHWQGGSCEIGVA